MVESGRKAEGGKGEAYGRKRLQLERGGIWMD